MKKTIGIILVFILVIMLGIGVTYAYFSAKISGLESASTLTLEAGELEIDVDGGNIISVSKIIPDSEVPFATKTITLTGKNTSIYLNMPYRLKLVVDNNTFTAGSIKYSISGVNDSNSGVIIPSQEMKDAGSTTIIGSGYFERGNPLTHTYTLKMYFPETEVDQNENMAAVYSAHIEVSGDEAEEPAPKGWWKAANGTLLAAIRDNSTLHIDETGMTIPGQQIADTDEGLRITTDDYGVSFYYRGAVESNYVVFANKCWRIVRITGDGSIKLVLYNDNPNGLTDAEVCGEVGNDLAYARYDGTNFLSSFNLQQNYNAYIGFMYGTPNSKSYEKEHENVHDSTILTNLKTWYDLDGTFTTNENKLLADTIWCGDKRVAEGSGIGTVNTSYAVRNRIIQSYETTNVSLICGADNKISKYTASDTIYGNGALNGYKIGLLTADELIYAGAMAGVSNTSYYLSKNATKNIWWLITPARYTSDETLARNWSTDKNGGLNNYYLRFNIGLRPSIALIPTVQATYNTSEGADAPGTVNNPYIVQTN